MDAVQERPEARSFGFDPIQYVLADRGRYVAAALTIARAYLGTDKKTKCTPLAGFAQWSAMVREALLWLDMEDPVNSMEQARQDDPKRAAARALIAQWKEHLGTTQSYKAAEIIAKARETQSNPSGRIGGGEPDWVWVYPEFYALLLEHAGERSNISAVKFGYWLRALRNQVYDDHRIVVSAQDNAHGNQWKLEQLDQRG
jgi:hypothetical protein